ncbi:hypothetical protein SNEBB_008886 [Seison nebaliae]|nr:hypothetical protein SNEBB_008886 [Seison nebaliae]
MIFLSSLFHLIISTSTVLSCNKGGRDDSLKQKRVEEMRKLEGAMQFVKTDEHLFEKFYRHDINKLEVQYRTSLERELMGYLSQDNKILTYFEKKVTYDVMQAYNESIRSTVGEASSAMFELTHSSEYIKQKDLAMQYSRLALLLEKRMHVYDLLMRQIQPLLTKLSGNVSNET